MVENMKQARDLIQTLQWCPSAWDVVTLEIDGEIAGRMVRGIVTRCNTCSPEKCQGKKLFFCWVGRQILTVLS